MANVIASQVQELYVGYLGRAADQAGLDFWTNAITAGTSTIESVALGFTLSQEYTSKYEGLSSEELAAAIYENVLGRAADADGLAFWVGELEKGVQTPETLLAAMINSLGAVDQKVIDNKVYVANAYTAAAGADYNAEAGAKILVGVDGTNASVTAALASLENGSLPGQIPALSLLKAINAAVTAQTALEKQTAQANPSIDTGKDGQVSQTELTAAASKAVAAREAAITAADSTITTYKATVQYEADAVVAGEALVAEKADLLALVGGSAAVARYEAAVIAESELTAVNKSGVAYKSAEAGFTAAVAAMSNADQAAFWTKVQQAALESTATNLDDFAELYSYLVNLASVNPIARANLVNAIKDIAFASETVELANNDVKLAAATAEKNTALLALGNLKDSSGNTVAASDVTEYTEALDEKVTADKVVVAAKAGDAKITELKAIQTQYTEAAKTIQNAKDALAKFDADNANLTLKDLSAAAPSLTTTDKTEVFYFASKAAADDDFQISSFGKGGDFLILGEGYAFNQGALSSGDNNALEFFITQGGAGAQIVIEASNFGTASAVVGTDGTVTQSSSDGVAVITLTGVSVDQLQVADGVVSLVV